MKQKINKIYVVLVFIGVLLIPIFGSAQVSFSTNQKTIAELQADIKNIQEQLIILLNQLIKIYQEKISELQGMTQLSITVTSPNGGEILIENSKVVDSLSSVDSENNIFEIKWSGAPDSFTDVYGDGKDPARIEAYLEQNNGGQFNTIGRIIPKAYGSITWIVGLVSDTNCLMNNYNALLYPNHCYHSERLVSPGNYYIRIVDTKTESTDRSDNYFSITP